MFGGGRGIGDGDHGCPQGACLLGYRPDLGVAPGGGDVADVDGPDSTGMFADGLQVDLRVLLA